MVVKDLNTRKIYKYGKKQRTEKWMEPISSWLRNAPTRCVTTTTKVRSLDDFGTWHRYANLYPASVSLRKTVISPLDKGRLTTYVIIIWCDVGIIGKGPNDHTNTVDLLNHRPTIYIFKMTPLVRSVYSFCGGRRRWEKGQAVYVEEPVTSMWTERSDVSISPARALPTTPASRCASNAEYSTVHVWLRSPRNLAFWFAS